MFIWDYSLSKLYSICLISTCVYFIECLFYSIHPYLLAPFILFQPDREKRVEQSPRGDAGTRRGEK